MTVAQITDRNPIWTLVSIPGCSSYEDHLWVNGRGYLRACCEEIAAQIKSQNRDKLDYVAIQSGDFSDLVFSNMDFFEELLANELKKLDVPLKLEGRVAGGGLRESVLRDFPNWKGDFYVSHYVLGRGTLYRVKQA